ncbi:dihydroorotase [Lichenicoccus sp.]|uniref:dihydroorotase n=1 Tax=Lichenicoccus sp. TaxID=2781899 RepID=UPI003D1463F0
MASSISTRFDTVLRGTLVTPGEILTGGWLAIRDGRIAALGVGAAPEAAETIDHGDSWLLPGVIDGQVHACNVRGYDGIESTTRSAIAGGVTTIVDMPYDEPEPLASVAQLRRKEAAIGRLAHCDVALYATVSRDQPISEIAALVEAGICAIKISSFENHPTRFPRIDSARTLDVLQAAARAGIVVGLHNEDQEIVRAATARLQAAGETGISAHSPSRPQAAELSATAQFLELGVATGAHTHIVHLSVPRGFDLVEQYGRSGARATGEMCVHYLLLDDEADGPLLGALMKVNPPIRGGVRDALWRALEAGQVAFVSSDHAGWPLERKQKPSIFDASAGVPGLETLLPGFFTIAAAHGTGETAFVHCARYLSEAPAKFFGLWPRKGALAVGADADVAVLERGSFPYDASQAHDALNWSPFDGMDFGVRVAATYLRGSAGVRSGRIASEPGWGRYCPRLVERLG